MEIGCPSHQRWHYVDMKEHDAEVIRREHMRQREYRRQKQMQRERERKEALRNILYFAKQKLIGLAFVAVSLWLIFSGIMYDLMVGENDCTFALITIPIGLILMFSKNRWFFDYQEDDDVWECVGNFIENYIAHTEKVVDNRFIKYYNVVNRKNLLWYDSFR